MPTGYTADLAEGNPLTFSQFVWRCARGMGALVIMRDEPHDAPIPTWFEPNLEYHLAEITNARGKMAWLETLTPGEIIIEAENDYRQQFKSWSERKISMDAQIERYRDMLAQVRAWDCKASGIKDFMIRQLEESIQWDGIEMPAPERLEPMAWFNKTMSSAIWHVDYHTTKMREEIDRTNERNKWLADLRASLPPEVTPS